MATTEPAHLMADLKELKLPAFAQHWSRLAEDTSTRRRGPAHYLAELAHLEVTGRTERRIARRIADARFPVLKTLDAFDFGAQPDVGRDAVLELATGEFVRDHANVVLLGGVGTGKTHLAIALALACCQRGMRVRFVTAAELTTDLVEAKAADRLSRRIEHFARFDLVVLDELGYVPFDRVGADLLFSFVTRVYERRSLLVTTNLPFGRWSEVFHDATAAAAVIDRVVHHATVLQTAGESYRLKDAKRRRRRRKGVPPK
jgi:DNA replication protein DnaC